MTLSDRELALLNSEMPNRQKSLAVAYLLWFFLGTLGIYHFYLGNAKRGWWMVVLSVIGFISLIVLIGIVILLGLFVVWIVDAIRMGSLVATQNTAIESSIINEIIATRPAGAA